MLIAPFRLANSPRKSNRDKGQRDQKTTAAAGVKAASKVADSQAKEPGGSKVVKLNAKQAQEVKVLVGKSATKQIGNEKVEGT